MVMQARKETGKQKGRLERGGGLSEKHQPKEGPTSQRELRRDIQGRELA